MNEKKEIAVEVRDRSAATEEVLKYTIYLYLEYVNRKLTKMRCIRSKQTQKSRSGTNFRTRSFQWFEWPPDAVVAGLEIKKPASPTRPVIELIGKGQVTESWPHP